MTNTGSALIGEMSIVASDGTELTASSDLGLAWKWAPIEVDAHLGAGTWFRLPYAAQVRQVADALTELRRAYGS
jgi:hypothetical protein